MKPIRYDRRFVKVFRKRIAPNVKLERQFQSRLKLFVAGKRDSPLNDHSLSGPMRGQRAFWITGDVRVVYIETATEIRLIDVGSHNQVYR